MQLVLIIAEHQEVQTMKYESCEIMLISIHLCLFRTLRRFANITVFPDSFSLKEILSKVSLLGFMFKLTMFLSISEFKL